MCTPRLLDLHATSLPHGFAGVSRVFHTRFAQIRANSRLFREFHALYFARSAPVSRLFRATSHLLQLRPFLVDKRFVEGQDGVPRVSNLQNLEISRWQSFLWGCGGNSRAQNATARRYEDIRAAIRGLRSQFRASFAPVSRQFRASFALVSRVSRSVIRLFRACFAQFRIRESVW